MDCDPNKQTKKKASIACGENAEVQGEEVSYRIDEGNLTNVSDVLFAIWVRCFIQTDNGSERFILGSRRCFLFHFRLLLVVLYIAYAFSK